MQQKLREAEEAERTGSRPRRYDTAQKIIRTPPTTGEVSRLAQIRTLGLIEPFARANADGLAALVKEGVPIDHAAAENLDAHWDGLSEAQKIRLGATERFELEATFILDEASLGHALPHKLSGRLEARNHDRLDTNLGAYIANFDHLLAPDSRIQLRSFLQTCRELVAEGQKERVIRGINAEVLSDILFDWTKKLIYQELVSRQRGMGDRGIRRAYQNLAVTQGIYEFLRKSGSFDVKQELLARMVAVHQDLGHTAFAARMSYRGTKMHRAYSARLFEDARNRLRPMFRHAELEAGATIVATHSTPRFPLMEQIVLALVRMSDHLVPFMPGRIGLHFRDHPSAHPYLEDMLNRATGGDIDGYLRAKEALADQLASLELDRSLRADMMAAFRPIERMADPLGTAALHGTITSTRLITQSPGGLECTLSREPFAQRYSALFGEQQELLWRLAESCGLNLDQLEIDKPIELQPPGGSFIRLIWEN